MSTELRTTGGEFFQAGFGSFDSSRIELGDLAPISVEQFSEYGADTIVAAIPSLTPEEIDGLSMHAHWQLEKLRELGVRTMPPHSEFASADEVNSRLGMALTTDSPPSERALAIEGMGALLQNDRGNLAAFYETNPFVVEGRTVRVADRYEVDVDQFIIFTLTYIGGGTFGWSKELGAPECTLLAMAKLCEFLGGNGQQP